MRYNLTSEGFTLGSQFLLLTQPVILCVLIIVWLVATIQVLQISPKIQVLVLSCILTKSWVFTTAYCSGSLTTIVVDITFSYVVTMRWCTCILTKTWDHLITTYYNESFATSVVTVKDTCSLSFWQSGDDHIIDQPLNVCKDVIQVARLHNTSWTP